ncbi:hypothetical protein XO10_01810 [Marinitoga sp. 1135]|uniref:HEAT repeat domain-containing protein n=1 Tax=Marinitoga piezophila (strain DSM 14283 / JCM 11233 / KA3) TaxID=443254 RepID=H2J4E4_MARPK|nr:MULTISPECIES: hypothetical protein [Marinitoga]AEX84799.1 hypothetical protein Marpi_0350 [Marinitoga piezophila KA3]APT75310.1 hypothetical protein LN42_02080 [Marinitoga sp. 1137]NUU95043.1 hypothetical protein [Marinitoga sp. 1135]NUU96997.1 hypothetical protein [Marinitoga sp. 1138]
MKREDVIQRIIEEKGVTAIPILIDMMEDSDAETYELIMDIIDIMGAEAKEYLFKEFLKRFNQKNLDDVVMLYLIDILSELECKELAPYLERMLELYSDERAFPIIIEALLRLTKDEKYLDILATYLNDEGEIQELAVMAMAELPVSKSINYLLNKYTENISKQQKALILDSIQKMLVKNKDLLPIVKEHPAGDEISEMLEWMLK